MGVDKKFTSGDMPLGDLLDQARDGELQLPDFQRGWVWDDNHITSLLASVSLSYPIGAVMTLETGNADVKLQPRPLEGVTLPEGVGVPGRSVRVLALRVELLVRVAMGPLSCWLVDLGLGVLAGSARACPYGH